MAIRERNGKWQVYWRDPGSQKIRSRTFADKREAEKENSLMRHRLTYERASITEQASTIAEETSAAEKMQNPTLNEVYILYLQQRDLTRKGIISHRARMQHALRILGNLPVDAITEHDCEIVMQELEKTTLRSSTKGAYMHTLKTVLNFAHRQGYRDTVEFPSVSSGICRTFVPPTPEEIGKAFDTAPPHIQRVLLIGAYCGARIGPSELFSLTWEHVDFSHNLLRIPACGKNREIGMREVPIRQSLVPVFKAWKEEDGGEGFLIHFNGQPIIKIGSAWKKMLNRAGVRYFRPYDLRHAFGTELVASGVDIGTVSRLMGHSNPMMLLKHYAYSMDKQKRAAVESLPEPCMSQTYKATEEQHESQTDQDF